MNTAFNCLTKLLALGCLLLFALSLPLALIVYDVEQALFDPPSVKRLAAEELLQVDWLPVFQDWLSRTLEQAAGGDPNAAAILAQLQDPDWQQIRRDLLPDDLIAGWIAASVDGIYAWIDAPGALPQIAWDLQPLRERISGEYGLNVILLVYRRLPVCTQADLDEFALRLLSAAPGEKAAYPLCQAPPPLDQQQVQAFQVVLSALANGIPASFSVTQALASTQTVPYSTLLAFKQTARLIRLARSWAWLPPLTLLLLILVLAVRSWRDLGRWWGSALLLAGLLALLPALSYPAVLPEWFSGVLNSIPAIARDAVSRFVMALAQEIFKPLLFQALIVLALGVSITIGMAAAKEKSDL